MRGKVAMVTGANSGMGKEIALALAGMGGRPTTVEGER
jgi:NAD(P)-dependent dehydrogenase (short-subunit alcohol dehydrogenase family)